MPHARFFPLLLAAASFPAFGSVDTALLALVPPGAKFVSGIDFDRARSSQFGQFLTSKMNTGNEGLEQFVSETGFDPRRDLQEVLFAGSGAGENAMATRFAILARGTFDQERITATAKTKGLVSQPYQGVSLFVDRSAGDGPKAFAFLGDGVGIMGDVDTVKQIISNRGTTTTPDPTLQAEINKVGTDNDAWFVSLLSGQFLANHLNAHLNGDQPDPETPADHPARPAMPQAQALQSVLQSSGGIQFGSTIRLSFDAVTRTPQDATSLADVVRFFASMVQMERQKDPRAAIGASAFDNMNLATDGNAMHLSLSLPEKSLEELIESGPKHAAVHAHGDMEHPHAQ